MTRNFVFNTLCRAIADPENVRAVVKVFKNGEVDETYFFDFDMLSDGELLDENRPRVGVWSLMPPDWGTSAAFERDYIELDCGVFRTYDEAVSFVFELVLNNDADLYIDLL